MQDLAFVYGIHTNRAKFMLSSVCWGLERGFFFIGLWIYWTVYANELLKWIIKFEETIKKINADHFETSENAISTSVVVVFILSWLIFALMAVLLFYIGNVKYSLYKRINRKETAV